MTVPLRARLIAGASALMLQMMSAHAASPTEISVTPAATASVQSYKIHSGDQLAVSVYGEPDLTQTTLVLSDGTIQCPMIGRHTVGGKSLEEAVASLNRAYGRYLRKPNVTVIVTSQGELTVMVLGNVITPGKYTLPFYSHVTDAIAAAGGMGPTNGDYPVARISDAQGVRDASLQAIQREGNAAADIVLNNNSVVYVPSPATFNVEVLGAVALPGEISISQGDRLTTAIAKAGASAKSSADLNAIRVVRHLANGQTKVYAVNLYKNIEQGQNAGNLVLEKSDVIYVPKAKDGSSTFSTIFGLLGSLVRF